VACAAGVAIFSPPANGSDQREEVGTGFDTAPLLDPVVSEFWGSDKTAADADKVYSARKHRAGGKNDVLSALERTPSFNSSPSNTEQKQVYRFKISNC
jgi:hypothetical protein